MKVLHVINNLAPAGAELLLAAVAPAMKRRGVDAEIATIYRYENRTVFESLTRQGVRIHSLDFRGRYDPRIPGALRKLASAGRYDIVHANLFPAFYWTALAASALDRMVVTEHSAVTRRTGRIFLKPVEQFVYGRYRTIVCISDRVRETLSAWLPMLASRMTVVYNGIDLGRFTEAEPLDTTQFGVPAGAPVCTMVARFYSPKDHATMINAAAMIPDLHVLFVGEGETRHAMQERTAALNLDKRIHFLGFRNDVPSLVKACDVCVQSSYNEGFSLATVEAMACGVPVIASNVPALNEIVQDGISGLLFTCGDSRDLAEKIRSVLAKRPLSAQLRSGGLQRAKNFSIENTVNGLLSLYGS